MQFYCFLDGIKFPIIPAITTGTIQLNPNEANGKLLTRGILHQNLLQLLIHLLIMPCMQHI